MLLITNNISLEIYLMLALEHRLYPNASSEVGFLAPGQNLESVLAEDAQLAAKYNITLYQVGCILERLVHKYGQGDFDVDGIYRMQPGLSTCGYQECPFEELDPTPITYGRSTIVVEKIATGERFQFESLVAHLVKEHGFCEGPGTPYRLDLEGAIRFFDIQPDVDYTPQSTTFYQWWFTGSHSSEKYLQYRSLALAEFTNKYFLALVLPMEFPTNFEMGATLYDGLLQSEIRTNKFGLKCGFPVESPEEIEAKVTRKVERATARTEKFQQGIHEEGLVLMLVASLEFDYPKQGLIATPGPETKARFQIPDLQLDVTEKYFHIPSCRFYTLKRGVRWN